jgi:SAP domain
MIVALSMGKSSCLVPANVPNANTTRDFSKAQADMSAAKRICNACGPPLPNDLNQLTKADLAAELKRRKCTVPANTAKKTEFIQRLQAATGLVVLIDARENSSNNDDDAENQAPNASTARACPKPPLQAYWKQLTVVELKQELKNRGLKVSGFKAVLAARLSDQTGIPADKPFTLSVVAAPFMPRSTALLATTESTTVDSVVVAIEEGIETKNTETPAPAKKEEEAAVPNAEPAKSTRESIISHHAKDLLTTVPKKNKLKKTKNTSIIQTRNEPAANASKDLTTKAPKKNKLKKTKTTNVRLTSNEPAVNASVAPNPTTATLLVCHGIEGCTKIVSLNCSFGCCGRCCKARIGRAVTTTDEQCKFKKHKM